MQKNWYIIYTKSGTEKKTASLLTKRKIHNFCAVNFKETGRGRRTKIVCAPLFPSYIFVYTTEIELLRVKHLEYVVNIVYWKGQPAKISEDEINSIKEFTSNYQDIKLGRSKVVENGIVTVKAPSYSIDGNLLLVKNDVMKVNLPSLGFTMIAEIKTENVKRSATSVWAKDLILQ